MRVKLRIVCLLFLWSACAAPQPQTAQEKAFPANAVFVEYEGAYYAQEKKDSLVYRCQSPLIWGERVQGQWQKCDTVPPIAASFLEWHLAELDSFASRRLAADTLKHIRFWAPWRLELKDVQNRPILNGNAVSFADGTKLRCVCDCASGNCQLYQNNSFFNCWGSCKMLPDGNPCNSCVFEYFK